MDISFVSPKMPLASACLSFRVPVRVSEQHVLTSQCNVTLTKGSPTADFALSLGHLSMWDGTGSKLMARVPTGKMWRAERQRPSPSGIVRRDSALPRSPDTVNETGSELRLPQACLASRGAEWPTSQDSSKAPRVQRFPPSSQAP